MQVGNHQQTLGLKTAYSVVCKDTKLNKRTKNTICFKSGSIMGGQVWTLRASILLLLDTLKTRLNPVNSWLPSLRRAKHAYGGIQACWRRDAAWPPSLTPFGHPWTNLYGFRAIRCREAAASPSKPTDVKQRCTNQQSRDQNKAYFFFEWSNYFLSTPIFFYHQPTAVIFKVFFFFFEFNENTRIVTDACFDQWSCFTWALHPGR